jgi:hypothetical protein
MDNTREVAWVESPFQLIAAAEYAASRGRAIDVALRVGPQMASSAEALIARRALFATVVPYLGIPWGLLTSRRSWIIGDGFSGQFHAALGVVGAREVTFVDDGLMTLQLARAIAGSEPFHRPGRSSGRGRSVLASLARDRLLALAARERLGFHTVFAGHDAVQGLESRGARITENDFDWLRQNGAPLTLPATTVVLGAAAVADGSLGAGRYLEWVRSTTAHGPVAYLPHRREPAAVLTAVAAIPGVTVVHTGVPVELALAGTTQALDIVTLPSTAALTLRALLAETGTTIRTRTLREPVS